MPPYDAILIPGGGLTKTGQPSPWIQTRLDKALEYRDRTKYLIPLSRASVHKPSPLDAQGFALDEARQAAQYLQNAGIAPERILLENFSLDTIGNAYFARTVHTDPAELRKLLIINSKFHMPRTRLIFDWVFSLTPLTHNYKLHYTETEDTGISLEHLAVRQTKEQQSINDLNAIKSKITELKQLHNWLFTQHKAYHAGEIHRQSDQNLLQTY